MAAEIRQMLSEWPATGTPEAWRERIHGICGQVVDEPLARERLARLLGTDERVARQWLLMLGDEARFESDLGIDFRSRLWVITCAWGPPAPSPTH